MPDHEPAREYIHAMIGHRTRISEAERDALHQLLNTPAVRARFTLLTREELCAIADSLVRPQLRWMGSIHFTLSGFSTGSMSRFTTTDSPSLRTRTHSSTSSALALISWCGTKGGT